MIEYNQAEQSELANLSEFGVKVIGVGGAGANVLDRMALEGSDDAELLTLNTDVRALSTSVSSEKIQLGATLLKGMGTGGDPSLGKQAAIEAVDEIRRAVRGCRMVFVCVGLGGGTGSGAAPEVCRIAREEGVFLVVFATMPFSFEGDRRMDQARTALEQIARYANAVITFDNDRMGELIVPKDGVAQAFAAADKIISQSIRATMNVVFRPGIIRIGMDDLLSAIASDDSRCLFGYGVAKGDNRSHEALEQALKCPLLDRGKLLNEATAVLVQVAGGDTMTLFEVQLVMEEVAKHVGKQTQILFGTGTDKRLGNSLTVTIISSIAGPSAAAIRSSQVEEVDAPPTISLGMPAIAEPIYTQPSSPASQFVEDEAAEEAEETEEAMPVSGIFEEESEDDVFSYDGEEENGDNASVFEPLDDSDDADEDAEVPAYAPAPVPSLLRSSAPSPDDSEAGVSEEDDFRNPIARALNLDSAQDDASATSGQDTPDLDRVEAVTQSSQKITLSRLLGGGNTGRFRTRDPLAPSTDGPVIPASSSREEVEPAEMSEEARQQQELLQLEPAPGKGRFAKTDPTIVDGEDLDVPTFLRKKK
jgi:cell division protein FtsZ